jgi:16S rRNA (uracil1498-N3)-methyltransferase
MERRTPRLYVSIPLAAGTVVPLAAGQAHHLRTVLRLGSGAPVAAFNAPNGEWMCRLGSAGDRSSVLMVQRQIRRAAPDADLWLLFAPVKRSRLDWLVEKATELGVSALLPVWTRNTQNERINLKRLAVHAVAAAEQSERLSVPELRTPQPLALILAEWPAGRRLFVCDETGAGEPVGRAIERQGAGPTACLTGPEGGFDETELDSMKKLPFVTRVGLGPRVLRADTAALAVLSAFQAIAGEWRCTRLR